MTSARTTASVSLGISRRMRCEHLLLVGADRRGQLGGLVVADGAGEALERRVGGDLQRLGGAGVLGVLEHLLLAAGAAQEVERRLAQRERLTDDGLDDADDGHQRVGALAERLAGGGRRASAWSRVSRRWVSRAER